MQIVEAFCKNNNIEYTVNALLSQHCTFKIGGRAGLLISPSNEKQIADVLDIISQENIPYQVLGKGSNILFSDDGYNGVILHFGGNFSGIELVDDTTIKAQSGASLSKLCIFARDNGLSGLEFAYGIPGSVGGAVYMNAGAYGGEIKDVAIKTQHITPDGKIEGYNKDSLDFSYRKSAYMHSGNIITSAYFKLEKADKHIISQKMDDFISRRREKQPLEYPSAGSTFKRPQNSYASALIDECGLKGELCGGAMVSAKHAGFLINYNNATADDMLSLIERVKAVVKQKTGFALECEVKMIGFDFID